MKRILAAAAIIVFFILTIATVAAGIAGASSNTLFALLFCSIAIPGSAYAFIIITRQIKNLNNTASFHDIPDNISGDISDDTPDDISNDIPDNIPNDIPDNMP
ncbi:hypothetical protein HMPREF9333_00500 [Johnsonella ignava ATCC 51276]|uniref:Uncharacterized protein n=1 Tax=Johnsonella ignava ATCC 51276 TaxID=679200 RepID=G5GG11_9FIRM|nr:hypothetical protein [Johnsonella ignava]EHI56221.1 hypothetical protein HMPREF9333_00500 [Johnsonella ignava ATCC 51276]